MICTRCQSTNRQEFDTEMMIHHGRLDSGKADILTFPKTPVCLTCGFSTFTVPKAELLAIRGAHGWLDHDEFAATKIVKS
jgi:hypothetical protein